MNVRRCVNLFLPTDDQDPDDPVPFINTDIKAAFQEMCRHASFDTLTGKATQPYDDGRVQPGDDIPPLKNYVLSLDTCTAPPPTTVIVITAGTRITSKAQLAVKGNGLEMMRYSLSQHPIIGRVFARHRNARGVGFADDLNIYLCLPQDSPQGAG